MKCIAGCMLSLLLYEEERLLATSHGTKPVAVQVIPVKKHSTTHVTGALTQKWFPHFARRRICKPHRPRRQGGERTLNTLEPTCHPQARMTQPRLDQARDYLIIVSKGGSGKPLLISSLEDIEGSKSLDIVHT